MANGVGVKSRLQALQIAYVLLSCLLQVSLALGACTRLLCDMPITVCPRLHGSWNASAD